MNYELLSHALATLCRHTGAFIRQEAQNFDRARVETKGLHDLVSYVDQETERRLVAGLRELLPEAGFITEEGTTGPPAEAAEHTWIIDPLDGTTNFVHGLPCYSISVALLHGKELVAGVVYEVNQDECFRAARGAGAYCNERPLRVSEAQALGQSLVATGFPYHSFERLDQYLQILGAFMRQTHGVRRVGSAAVDLAWVAAGRFEGFFEFNLNAYDVAAGILLVREAGGQVTQWLEAGDPLFGRQVLATNGHLHGAMRDVLAEFWM